MKAKGDVRFWRDPDLPGLEISFFDNTAHVFPKHIHDDFFAVSFMRSGGSFCLGPESEQSFVAPGELALINPGQVHSGVPLRGCSISYDMVYLSNGLFCELTTEIRGSSNTDPEFETLVVHATEIAGAFDTAIRRICCSEDILEKQTLLFDAVSCLGRRPFLSKPSPRSRANSKPVAVNRACELLESDLAENLTLDRVSRYVGMSRYHFLRVFRDAVGVPPHVFRTQCRIEAAKRALMKGISTLETAMATGFADQSHFQRKFKQYTGATPRQYVQSARSRSSFAAV